MQYHLNLVACAGFSGAGAKTAREALVAIADDWIYAFDRQRFLITQPTVNTPKLQAAVERIRRYESGALTELLDTAAKSLNSEIPEQWRKLIEKFGGRGMRYQSEQGFCSGMQ